MNIAITSFLFGLIATASPCVLPLYPGFLAYLSGTGGTESGKRSRYFLGFFVLVGVLTMMLALGGLIALLAVPTGRILAIIVPLADLLILLLGVLVLLDRNPFTYFPQIQVPVLRSPFVNAFVYGLLYGPIALPCSGPFIVSIFALSFTAGEAFGKLWLFLSFGLGFGVPLLILSLLSGVLQRQITVAFARHSRLLNIIGGLLLIGVAIYDLSQNWIMLKIFYSWVPTPARVNLIACCCLLVKFRSNTRRDPWLN